LAVTDWRLRRWRLWFLALSNAPHSNLVQEFYDLKFKGFFLMFLNVLAKRLKQIEKTMLKNEEIFTLKYGCCY